jgi:hypothetical protein
VEEEMRQRVPLVSLPKVPVLITESADDFQDLNDAVDREMKPRGIIEYLYARDVSYDQWEIERLRRCRTTIIKLAFRSALEDILVQLLLQPHQHEHEVRQEAQELVQAWFTDEEAKKQVSELLTQFNLDGSAIEAEAMRSCFSDLESLDRMIASLESRRNDAVRFFVGYRASVASQLQENTDQITGNVHRLPDASRKRSTAA